MTIPPIPAAQALADELLVVRCQLGERPAFDALIARWHQPLWRYARNLTGNDAGADDATQEVWLRVLRGIGRLRSGASLRAWLFGIAHHVLMDRLREKYAAPESMDAEVDDIAAPEPPPDLHAELSLMLRELARLPAIENEVLTLFYLRELTLEEVALALAVPVGTVKSRLFRARKLLRREMESKGVQS